MKNCFEVEKKKFWNCQTSDQEIYQCNCCNYTGNENCRDRFFGHSLLFHSPHMPSKIHPAYELGDYYENEKEEKDEIEIQNLQHLFQECKLRSHLPLWCDIESEYLNVSTCGCTIKAGEQHLETVYFNKSDIWNAYSCEFTKEHNLLLRSEYTYIMHFRLLIAFIIIILLNLIGYFIFKKMKKILFARRNDDLMYLI